jgi:fructose-1,6-bisphosphatase-3
MALASNSTSQEMRLLQLLSARYPTITAAHVEMINLNAILALPKGTDHYISDIHGAYEQFDHILRHASGAIHRKIAQTFETELSESEQIELAMLIYYPEQKLEQMLQTKPAVEAWMPELIGQLAQVARTSAQKYTRSKVRKRLPAQFAYILEELLSESQSDHTQKEHYYQSIIHSIVAMEEGERVIIALSYLIQSLVVDRLYILGDIYDRGPAAEKVMDRLMAYHYVSIQWGNHDVSWMGAASGCDALIANVVRLSLRYDNLETLSDGYSIDLMPLARFAERVYGDDPASRFLPKSNASTEEFSPQTVARMHKAIAIIQFKLEAQIIKRHPEYDMEDRILLDKIDTTCSQIVLDGKPYPLNDTFWPTLQPNDPNALTTEEQAIVDWLGQQFRQSKRLHQHMRFLYSYGNMFQVQDGNLKFHGCLPVDEQGEFIECQLGDQSYAGPALLARYEQLVRKAYFSANQADRQLGQDSIWYLWCGPQSPLFGRARMTTFERYFIDDHATHEEPKGAYYDLRHSEAFCRKVLSAFGGDSEHGLIINGHTPVKKGERPLLANGRLVIIDGGMSEPYQPVTGIAGYTLIGNSHEMALAAHEAFISAEQMIRENIDVTPSTERIEGFKRRKLIADTDTGELLQGQLEDLEKLVAAYRSGLLVENGADQGTILPNIPIV